MFEEIREQTRLVMEEILSLTDPKPGSLFVVGCSSSTVFGQSYGTASSPEAAQVLFDVIYPMLRERGVYLAAQCCEHLNRAIILPEEAAMRQGQEVVNVVPQPKAGGSFATIAYQTIPHAAAVEHIRADAGMDIGGVLIGMHLKEVAVPLHLTHTMIGQAHITAARTRPKYIGGERAHYDERLA